jgi:hypothetical protein
MAAQYNRDEWMVVKLISTPNAMQTRPLLETKNMRRVQDYLVRGKSKNKNQEFQNQDRHDAMKTKSTRKRETIARNNTQQTEQKFHSQRPSLKHIATA